MAKKSNHSHYKHEGGFVGLPRIVFNSDKYSQLNAYARCILFEFCNTHRPENNGRIRMTEDYMCKRLNCSPNTARKAIRQLIEYGFIERTFRHNFRRGKACEYRLTFQPYKGQEPTNDFLH